MHETRECCNSISTMDGWRSVRGRWTVKYAWEYNPVRTIATQSTGSVKLFLNKRLNLIIRLQLKHRNGPTNMGDWSRLFGIELEKIWFSVLKWLMGTESHKYGYRLTRGHTTIPSPGQTIVTMPNHPLQANPSLPCPTTPSRPTHRHHAKPPLPGQTTINMPNPPCQVKSPLSDKTTHIASETRNRDSQFPI